MLNLPTTVFHQLLHLINFLERRTSKINHYQFMVLALLNKMQSKYLRDKKMLAPKHLQLMPIQVMDISRIIRKDCIQIWLVLHLAKTPISIISNTVIQIRRFKKISSTDNKLNISETEIQDLTQEVWALVTTSE
jgi:hypothetical protein